LLGAEAGTSSKFVTRSRFKQKNAVSPQSVMGTHSFIRYFVTVTVTSLVTTVTSLVTAVTNEFLFSPACSEVTEAIGDLKID
jgi:hypothetical protein